jgi:uncharacterized membrane-anchored protein YitT (DUF2179 family)
MKSVLAAFFNKNNLFDVAMVTIGSVLWVVALVALLVPNALLSLGFTGVAIIINYFLSFLPISVLIYLMNVPCIILAWKELDKRFLFLTLYAVTLQSVLMEVLKNMPSYIGDPMLVAIFAGVLGGLGSGIVIRRGGSGGGTDILGVIVKKRWGYSVGTFSLAFNICVISLGAVLFGLEIAMYTVIFIAVCSFMTDKAIAGMGKKYTVMIVTAYPENVKNAIFDRLHRGVTFLKGKSAFSGDQKDVIYCAINQYELAVLKDMIYTIDPDVFMTISETTEIYGHFRSRKGDAITAHELENSFVEAAQEPVSAKIERETPVINIINKDHEIVDKEEVGSERKNTWYPPRSLRNK